MLIIFYNLSTVEKYCSKYKNFLNLVPCLSFLTTVLTLSGKLISHNFVKAFFSALHVYVNLQLLLRVCFARPTLNLSFKIAASYR